MSLSDYVSNIFSIAGCLNLIFLLFYNIFYIFYVKTYLKMFNTSFIEFFGLINMGLDTKIMKIGLFLAIL